MDCNLKHISGAYKSNTVTYLEKLILKKEIWYINVCVRACVRVCV